MNIYIYNVILGFKTESPFFGAVDDNGWCVGLCPNLEDFTRIIKNYIIKHSPCKRVYFNFTPPHDGSTIYNSGFGWDVYERYLPLSEEQKGVFFDQFRILD